MKKLIATLFFLSAFYLSYANDFTNTSKVNNIRKIKLNHRKQSISKEIQEINTEIEIPGVNYLVNRGMNLYNFYRKIEETDIYRNKSFRIYNTVSYDEIGLFVEMKY